MGSAGGAARYHRSALGRAAATPPAVTVSRCWADAPGPTCQVSSGLIACTSRVNSSVAGDGWCGLISRPSVDHQFQNAVTGCSCAARCVDLFRLKNAMGRVCQADGPFDSSLRSSLRERGNTLRSSLRERGNTLRSSLRERGNTLRSSLRERGNRLRQSLPSTARAAAKRAIGTR